MSKTLRKTDISNEPYIKEKKIKSIDHKHQTVFVADGACPNSISDECDSYEDPTSKKILKQEEARKIRHKNHEEERKKNYED